MCHAQQLLYKLYILKTTMIINDIVQCRAKYDVQYSNKLFAYFVI